MNPDQPETVTHPVLGELRWEAESGWWVGRIANAPGGGFDLFVEVTEGDRFAVLEPSAVLYKKALRSERQILRTALREEVLELYNETWSADPEPLTEKELMSRLRLGLVAINIDGANAVEFHYGGQLFGGHVLVIELDEKLKYQDCDLRG